MAQKKRKVQIDSGPKLSRATDSCLGCGVTFQFLTYHTPHCTNPKGSPVVALLQDKGWQ